MDNKIIMAVSELAYVAGWLEGFANMDLEHNPSFKAQIKRIEYAMGVLKELEKTSITVEHQQALDDGRFA